MAAFAHRVAADENASRVTDIFDGARHMGVFSGRQMLMGAFNEIEHAAEGFEVCNGIVSAAFAEVDRARASPPTTIIVLHMCWFSRLNHVSIANVELKLLSEPRRRCSVGNICTRDATNL